ncbi:hypothetical protein NJB1604_21230 [Mycobacterium marinum]|nr:hypothetical protein NJB1604_21230 [Mycobacterium marinum]
MQEGCPYVVPDVDPADIAEEEVAPWDFDVDPPTLDDISVGSELERSGSDGPGFSSDGPGFSSDEEMGPGDAPKGRWRGSVLCVVTGGALVSCWDGLLVETPIRGCG